MHTKSNLGPETPALTFSIDAGRFSWGGESSLTAEELLAVSVEAEAKSQVDEAKEFLASALESGPVKSLEVKAQAREAGISERTLWRAKSILKVKANKDGFEGCWYWSLPAEECQGSCNYANDATVAEMAELGEGGTLQTENKGRHDMGWAV